MIAVGSLLVIVLLILMVTRIATVAMVATGLPHEVAKFQARSALSGVGFTTSESESIVNHPIRRRIAGSLMLVGNAGFVTIVASLIFSFAGTASTEEVFGRLFLIILGLTPIFLIARSQRFSVWLTGRITNALNRWSDLDVRDMVNLMQLTKDYAISELQVQPGDWVADQPLESLHLPDEGVLVLAVQRADGSFVGAPRGGTVIHGYDTLVLYGRSSVLADLDDRAADIEGDIAHREAVAEQEHITAEMQALTDPEDPDD